MDDERFWSDGMMDLPQARTADYMRELLIEGEWTAPDGNITILRNWRGAEAPAADERLPDQDLPTAITVDDLPDFGAIYDLISGDAPEPIPEVDQRPCYDQPCPPLEEMTIRIAGPVVLPPWVSAALDRVQREWSDYLHRAHGIEPNGRHRVITRPALAGGYWLSEVPNEPPLIVETLCERHTDQFLLPT